MRLASDRNDQIRRLDSELLGVQDVTSALMVSVLALAEIRRSAPSSRKPGRPDPRFDSLTGVDGRSACPPRIRAAAVEIAFHYLRGRRMVLQPRPSMAAAGMARRYRNRLPSGAAAGHFGSLCRGVRRHVTFDRGRAHGAVSSARSQCGGLLRQFLLIAYVCYARCAGHCSRTRFVIRPVTFLIRRRDFMRGRIDFTWNLYANSADGVSHDLGLRSSVVDPDRESVEGGLHEESTICRRRVPCNHRG